jgi:outer membrane lipoprotein-sorting protein
MFRNSFQNRRTFLASSAAMISGFWVGNGSAGRLLADQTQLAARIQEAPSSSPLQPALKLASQSLEALADVRDYKATFTKRELVGRKTMDTRMELKLREEPFSVYLKFLQPHAGREVIYVAGKNSDQLQVHDVGFASLAGTLSLDPTGSMAMDENRHPLTSIGMRNMATKLIEEWLSVLEIPGMSVNFFPNAHIGQLACKAVEVSLPKNRASAEFQLTRLYVDAEKGYPIRLQAYDFPSKRETASPLVEDYLYSDLVINPGLTDEDFSTANPKYNY